MSDDFRTRAALERVAATHGLDEVQTGALAAYVELLLGWRRANVTGLTDPVAVVDTLIGDSLALLAVPQLREREQGAWLDLGAGAGIPGIPLAVALPGVAHHPARRGRQEVRLSRGGGRRRAGSRGRAQVVCARSERYAAAGSRRARGARASCSRAPSPSWPCWSSSPLRCSPWTACCWRARRGRRSRRRARRRRRRAGAAASTAGAVRAPLGVAAGRRRLRRLPQVGAGRRLAPAARGHGRQAAARRLTPGRPRRAGCRVISASIGAPRKEPGDPRHRRDQPEGRGRQDHHRRQPRRLSRRGRVRRAPAGHGPPGQRLGRARRARRRTRGSRATACWAGPPASREATVPTAVDHLFARAGLPRPRRRRGRARQRRRQRVRARVRARRPRRRATTSSSSTARRRSACSPSTRWSRRARCSSRCRRSTTRSRGWRRCSRRSGWCRSISTRSSRSSACVVTMYDGRTRLGREVAGEVREHLGEHVFQTIVPRNVRLSEAPEPRAPHLAL